MTGFSASWLDLREPVDLRSRDPGLLSAAAAAALGRADPLVVDLGTGTGSMARALAPLLDGRIRWRLVDADEALLAEAQARAVDLPGHAETVVHDLASDGPFPVSAAALVTASALFDLVSDPFAERLVAGLFENRSHLYACLIYDGTTAWDPSHPLDAPVVAAFNRHQRRDKGFGPALGPTAAAVFADKLARAGFQVQSAASPWVMGPEDAALQRELVLGIAGAVREEGSVASQDVDGWLDFRLRHAESRRCTVGHVDLFASI